MANIKINQIQLTGSLTSGDSFIVLDEETQATKRASLATISDYVKEDTLVHPAVDDMAERNSLSVEDGDVVRVKSTGELFVWDQENAKWFVIPHSSNKKELFEYKSGHANYITIYVKTSGDDENGDGTQEFPFASVERALKFIPTGYEASFFIKVSPGEYNDTSWEAPSPGSRAVIRVIGDLSSEGEVITLTSDNFPASLVAHPSGLGNYFSFREFNFPVWQTPISGNLPTIYPTYERGTTPEYMLLQTEPSYPSYFYMSKFVVLPGSDNEAGKMRLLTTGIYYEDDYRLVHKNSFPHFPNLAGARNLYEITYLRFSKGTFRGCTLEGCFFDVSDTSFGPMLKGTRANSCVFSKQSHAYSNPAFITYEDPVSLTNPYSSFSFAGCYSDMGISLRNSRIYVDRSIIATMYMDTPKIMLESVVGPYVIPGFSAIQYMGYTDFIGGGLGIDVQSGIVTTYNTLTFDGVSKPLVLNNGSTFLRRGGSPIGTSTSYSQIGVKCSTSHPTEPSSSAIAIWNVQNTVDPGQEIKVGNNPVTTYASLPQTDFALGNDSMGAIGK